MPNELRFRTVVLLLALTGSACKVAPQPVGSTMKGLQPPNSSARPDLPAEFAQAVPWRTASHGMLGAVCRGTVWLEGHLARPYQRREFSVERRYGLHEASGRLTILETSSLEGETSHGRAVLEPERYALEEDGEARTLQKAELRELRADVLRLFPEAFLREFGGDMREVDASARGQRLFLGSDAEGEPRRLLQTSAPAAWLVSRMRFHPVWGEVVVEERFAPTASSLHLVRTERGEVVEDLHCEPLAWSEAEAAALAAATLTPVSSDEGPAPRSVPEIDDLAKGVFVARYTSLNHRSLIIERRDDLVVVEAPVDSDATEGLLTALAQRWPEKRVGLLIVTHHHPDHAGGIRPFIARDVPVLTTPGNVAYFEDFARGDFHRAPDRLWHEPRRPRFVTVGAHHELGDGDVRIQLFDVGPETAHTAENLIVYVPHAELVFHGDLLAVPVNGVVKPAGARTRGLAAAVSARGLAVSSYVGAWPLSGYLTSVSAAQLQRALELEPRK